MSIDAELVERAMDRADALCIGGSNRDAYDAFDIELSAVEKILETCVSGAVMAILGGEASGEAMIRLAGHAFLAGVISSRMEMGVTE